MERRTFVCLLERCLPRQPGKSGAARIAAGVPCQHRRKRLVRVGSFSAPQLLPSQCSGSQHSADLGGPQRATPRAAPPRRAPDHNRGVGTARGGMRGAAQGGAPAGQAPPPGLREETKVKNAKTSSADKKGNKIVGGHRNNDWSEYSWRGTALDIFVSLTTFCICKIVSSSLSSNRVPILVICMFYLLRSPCSNSREEAFYILGKSECL
ncbi:uncharacterized protein LOC116880592 [Lontra canadensis]|uniref:uncharacterized protein LOC116880592 n=1 Tax=Lontra canadensis TaxID=76717 RepID=UPI0013F31BAC|nr:uncharacterized protein LOC116880592 [Lontra canadensis]